MSDNQQSREEKEQQRLDNAFLAKQLPPGTIKLEPE
jgi:hypothetical protein